MATSSTMDDSSVDFLHELGSRMASADALHEVLARVVDFASALVRCDSCLIYVLENQELLLRASKNPHPEVVDRLKLQVGEGITGWVAKMGVPLRVPDVRADPHYVSVRKDIRSELAVPLLVEVGVGQNWRDLE